MKRLGRVSLSVGYTVDLDNQEMVDEAKNCVVEDVMSMVKYNECDSWIKVEEDELLEEGDIPEFLMDRMEEGE